MTPLFPPRAVTSPKWVRVRSLPATNCCSSATPGCGRGAAHYRGDASRLTYDRILVPATTARCGPRLPMITATNGCSSSKFSGSAVAARGDRDLHFPALAGGPAGDPRRPQKGLRSSGPRRANRRTDGRLCDLWLHASSDGKVISKALCYLD